MKVVKSWVSQLVPGVFTRYASVRRIARVFASVEARLFVSAEEPAPAGALYGVERPIRRVKLHTKQRFVRCRSFEGPGHQLYCCYTCKEAAAHRSTERR